MRLSAACGFVSPSPEVAATVEQYLASRVGSDTWVSSILSPIEPTYPARCIDGRPILGTKTPSVSDYPRSAGGFLSTWLSDLIFTQWANSAGDPAIGDTRSQRSWAPADTESTSSARIAQICTTMHLRGKPVSCHRAQTSDPENSGCGAADKVLTVLDLWEANSSWIYQMIRTWQFDITDLQVLPHASALPADLPSGEHLISAIEPFATHRGTTLSGDHKEVAVVVNLRHGTTVNNPILGTELGGILAESLTVPAFCAQVFALDAWAFSSIADFLLTEYSGRYHRLLSPKQACATVAQVNVATLLTLCGSTMPIVVVS